MFSFLILIQIKYTTSFSRYPALNAIWFSFIRLASRDRFAAILFFRRLAQYLSSFRSSGTNCFLDFLIIGCGLSSSSENALVRGSKSRDDDIENAEKLNTRIKITELRIDFFKFELLCDDG